MVRAFFICLILLVSMPLYAVDFYFHKPYAQPNADYELKLLRLALDHTPGKHKIILVDYDTINTQARYFRGLQDGTADVNIMFSGYSAEREQMLRMIYIPITRGLLGHRVFLVKQHARQLFDDITSLQQLTERVSVGVGVTRPSKTILPAAGFTIVTSPGNHMVKMLLRGRFTGLLFGLDEINLLQNRISKMEGGADIVTETRFVISFPFDSFFFVGPDDTRRADIVSSGLKLAYESGAFMQHFESFPPIKTGLELVAKHQPTIFEIDNPNLSIAVKAIPKKYWHDFTQAPE